MWKLSFLVVTATAAKANVSETPAQKVITLLTDLKAKAQEELDKETEVFTKFLDFAKAKIEEKSASIDADNLAIETASGGIDAAKAAISTAQSDFATAKAEQTKKSKELDDKTQSWLASKAKLQATEADLGGAVDSLGRAITHLESSKDTGLVSLRTTIRHNLQLADALGLSSSHKISLLSNDPGEYDFHSGDVVSTLNTLKTEFTNKHTEVQEEFEKQKKAYDEYKSAALEGINAAKESAQGAKDVEDQETENLGKHELDLANAEIDLKNDSQYHKSIDERFNTKKAEWAQREKGRKDEIQAIEGALVSLETALGKEAGRTKKTFIQQEIAKAQKQSAIKADVEDDVLLSAPFFLQTTAFLAPVSRHERAVEFVLERGKALKSATLVSLSTEMSGPFDKVKRLIQSLIERLLEEAANEAGHQSKCAVERKEAEMKRDYRAADIQAKNAEIQSLSANKDKLEVLIEELTVETGELDTTLAEEAELRKEDKDNNITAVKDAKEGLAALEEAVKTLREYYKGIHGVGGADTAAVTLLQASPVDEEAEYQAVADLKGAYKGSQDSAGNIFGLLAVVKSDFQREISTTQSDEKNAQEAFVKQKREDTALLAGKRVELANSENDLKTTKSKIGTAFDDLKSAVDRQGKAIKILELLWERCVSVEMSWEERKAKIEQEIEALKKAVTILGGESKF